MAGLNWQISVYVECETCAVKNYNDGGGRALAQTTAYKFTPSDDDLDGLRMEFLEDLELKGWEVRDLTVWDDLGKWYCTSCVRAENVQNELELSDAKQV